MDEWTDEWMDGYMQVCVMYDTSQLTRWGQRPRLSIRKSITALVPTAAARLIVGRRYTRRIDTQRGRSRLGKFHYLVRRSS
jgi:hypothetical protein